MLDPHRFQYVGYGKNIVKLMALDNKLVVSYDDIKTVPMAGRDIDVIDDSRYRRESLGL